MKVLALLLGLMVGVAGQVTSYPPPSGGGGGGSGDIEGVTAGCGVGGGGSTGTVTVKVAPVLSAQTGTTYTFLDADCGTVVSLSNAGSVAVTLPQANGSTFVATWWVDVVNIGAGTATITPTTSTINGAATLVLLSKQSARIVSNGTNYTAVVSQNATLLAGTTPSAAGLSVVGAADAAAQRTALGLGDAATLSLASQAEAEAGTSTTTLMNPLRTAQAISALGGGGGGGATALSGLTDLKTTVSSTVATTATGRVDINGTSTSIGAGTITKNSGTDTGTFRIYVTSAGALTCLYGSGISIGNYTVSSGFAGSTCASGSAFPADSIPLATMDVTSGTLQTPTDVRALFQRDTATAGTGLTKSSQTFSVDDTLIPNYSGTGKTGKCAEWSDDNTLVKAASDDACGAGGGASFPPTDITIDIRFIDGFANGKNYSYDGACGGKTPSAPTATFPMMGLAAGDVGCNVRVPADTGSDKGFGPFHGGTPVAMQSVVWGGRLASGTSNDVYYAYCDDPTSAANCFGVRWSNSASSWQCFIRSGGSDVDADNLSGGSDTSPHQFIIDNNSATANTVRCSIDGGSTVTSTGTIPTPTGGFHFTALAPSASTDFQIIWLYLKLK